MSKLSLKSDFLTMNVSWYPNELKLFTNQTSIELSTILTIILIITFLLGVIVQKAIFKMLKRLPERAINQIIYPYMVKTVAQSICTHYSCFENMGRFVTLKKRSKKAAWPLLFLNSNDPVFCTLLFAPHILDLTFFSVSQTDPCFQNKNSAQRCILQVSFPVDLLL